MFGQVFDPDNLLWRIVSRGVDFVGLGLFWALLCLPVVTVIPATAALYYTVVKVFRQGEEQGFRVLWCSFVSNLRRGIPINLICLPCAVLLMYGHAVMVANSADALGKFMYMAYYVALVLPCGVLCWLVPMLGRFEQKASGLFSTAFVLTLRHLPTSFVLVLLNSQLLIWTLESWWPVFFTPVLANLLTSLFLERIFPRYLSEEERERLQPAPPERE